VSERIGFGPLVGKRILITRAREQASALSELLHSRGAQPIELPTIQFVPPSDDAPLDAAIRKLDEYDWLIFTSVNGVKWFQRRLGVPNSSAARVAAIGPATAAAVAELGWSVDVVPTTYVAEAVVEELARLGVGGKRILIPRAEEARDVLADGLTARGAGVDVVAVYRTVPASDSASARALFERETIDVVTLTSSSTARNLVALLGDDAQKLLAGVAVASIGPITSGTARELGVEVAVEATDHTIPGLVAALERHFGG
jgi:uroporphyrinogen-III synthase